MPTLSGPPTDDSIIQTNPLSSTRREPFFASLSWIRWFLDTLMPALQASPQIKRILALTNQSASILATALPLGSLPAGVYEVSYYARITTPDGAASSLTPSIGWTDGGIAQSLTGAAMIGNAVTTVQSGSAIIAIDAASAITYATAYTSTTPTQMRYKFTVVVKFLGTGT